MEHKISNDNAENVSTRRLAASGIDQEVIHRIRNRGRIERAKVVRRWFAALGRATFGRIAAPGQTGRCVS